MHKSSCTSKCSCDNGQLRYLKMLFKHENQLPHQTDRASAATATRKNVMKYEAPRHSALYNIKSRSHHSKLNWTELDWTWVANTCKPTGTFTSHALEFDNSSLRTTVREPRDIIRFVCDQSERSRSIWRDAVLRAWPMNAQCNWVD